MHLTYHKRTFLVVIFLTINDIGDKYNVNNYCPLINEIIKSNISSNKEICISKEIYTNNVS